jgi:hypothetical protein
MIMMKTDTKIGGYPNDGIEMVTGEIELTIIYPNRIVVQNG